MPPVCDAFDGVGTRDRPGGRSGRGKVVEGILEEWIVGFLAKPVVGLVRESVVGSLAKLVVGLVGESVVGSLAKQIVGLVRESVVGSLAKLVVECEGSAEVFGQESVVVDPRARGHPAQLQFARSFKCWKFVLEDAEPFKLRRPDRWVSREGSSECSVSGNRVDAQGPFEQEDSEVHRASGQRTKREDIDIGAATGQPLECEVPRRRVVRRELAKTLGVQGRAVRGQDESE